MFWVKSEVYTSPTFFTIESMRYNTGSLISARTYMNRTNIFGGLLFAEAPLSFQSWKTPAMSLHYYIQDSQTCLHVTGPNFSKATFQWNYWHLDNGGKWNFQCDCKWSSTLGVQEYTMEKLAQKGLSEWYHICARILKTWCIPHQVF